MLRKLSGILLFLVLGCGTAFAQNTLKGTVKDAGGAPLAGTVVMVQGTKTGTVTDLDGNYSIKVTNGAKVEYSILGYSTQVFEYNGELLVMR